MSAAAAAALAPLSQIPGPRAWPLLGTVPGFVRKVKGFTPPKGPQFTKAYHDYYKEFGPIYQLNMFGVPEVHVCKPEEYIKVYRSEGRHPPGGSEAIWMMHRFAERKGYKKLRALMSRGEEWRDIRQTVQEDLISPKAARTYLPFVNEACRLAAPHFSEYAKTPAKFGTFMAFDMFFSVLTGLQMKSATGTASAEDMNFISETQETFQSMGRLLFSQHLKWEIFRNHPVNTRYQEVMEKTHAYACKLLDKSLEELKNAPDDQKPYIVKLLDRGTATTEDVKEVLPFFVMAGIDTTQTVIMWNLLHLAGNPDKQERLREEILRVLGPDGVLTADVAASLKSRLPYLRGVVREVHRVSPPTAAMTMRTAPCDLELDGYFVPEGTKCIFNVYSLQNDPKYVDAPEEFRPERWLPEAVEARAGTEKEIIDHGLLGTPFSFGARMCVAGRVADLEIYALLCQLVTNWRFTTVEENPSYDVIQPLFTLAHPYPSFNIEPITR